MKRLISTTLLLTLVAACAADAAPASEVDTGSDANVFTNLPEDADTSERPDKGGAPDTPEPDSESSDLDATADVAPDLPPPPPCSSIGLTAPCDARSDCSWFACAERCASADAPLETICPPTCGDQADQYECTFALPDCRWDECDRRCRDTSNRLPGCAPSQGSCGDNSEVGACNAAGCAWYACTNQCYPPESSLALICGQGYCLPHRSRSACDDNTPCQWFSCVEGCYEPGALEPDVCPP